MKNTTSVDSLTSMNDESQGRNGVCHTKESINWKQCILCQSNDKNKGHLMQYPIRDLWDHTAGNLREAQF